MQHLLMEGLRITCLTPDSPTVQSGVEVFDPNLGAAYGHLAAALRLHMVDATDKQLETLTSPRFLPALELAFTFGAL